MKKKNGFTLIELLATVVILVAILAIAMPNILQVINKRKEKTITQEQEMMISYAELMASKYSKVFVCLTKDTNNGLSLNKIKKHTTITEDMVKDLNPASCIIYDNGKYEYIEGCGDEYTDCGEDEYLK